MNDPTLDARRMAALLDGRLGADARQQMLGALAASDEALDTYADAAAVLAELEREGVVTAVAPVADDGAGPVVEKASVASIAAARARRRHAARWRVPRWAALAAGIAVMVAVPALWWRARPGADIGTAPPTPDAVAPAPNGMPSYVALLAPEARAAGLPAGWEGRPWRTTRGAGDPLTPEARGVRVGARLTDMELAVAAGDAAAARGTAAEVAALLDEVPGGGAAAAAYRALGGSGMLSVGAPGAAALARARRDAALVAGAGDVALGAWLEAARVAAARRDAAFFQTAESRAALGRVRGSGGVETQGAADRVAAAAGREPPAWERLGAELTMLLRTLAG